MTIAQHHSLRRRLLPLILILAFALSSICSAADTTPGLTVREPSASLYSRQEADSDKIATLQKGELLTPLAEAVGQQTWYMVKTQQWFGRLGALDRCIGRGPTKTGLQRTAETLYLERSNRYGTHTRRQLDGGSRRFTGQSVGHVDVRRSVGQARIARHLVRTKIFYRLEWHLAGRSSRSTAGIHRQLDG